MSCPLDNISFIFKWIKWRIIKYVTSTFRKWWPQPTAANNNIDLFDISDFLKCDTQVKHTSFG